MDNTQDSLKKTLKSNMLWNSAGSMVYLGCQWLATLMVVRLSTSLDAAGYFNLAISITGIFATVASYNMRTYIISDSDNKISSGEYAGFRILTCGFSFVACLIYSALFGYSITQYLAIVIYMLLRLTESIVDLFYAFEQKALRMDIGGKSMIMRGILQLITFILVFTTTQNIIDALIGMVLVTLAVIFFYDYQQAKNYASYKPIFSRAYATLFRDGTFITTIWSASDFIITFPKQMVDSFLGTAVAGAYTTVSAPLNVIQVGVNLIFNPLLPLYDSALKAGRLDTYLKYLRKTILSISLFSIFAIYVAVVLGEPVLGLLYGAETASYAYLLPILTTAICIYALQDFIRILLIMMRVFIPQLVITLLAAIACCLLSQSVISSLGVMGACYVMLGCYVFSATATIFVFVYQLKKRFKM